MRDKKTFSIAFPDISNLEVTIVESGKGISSKTNTRKYSHADITKTIKCANPDCRKGGFNIATILWRMASNQSASFSEIVNCSGFEGNPQTKRKRNPCLNTFQFSIELKYK